MMALNFMFQMNPTLTVLIISLVISFIIVIVYKYLTNQKEMKEMKDKLKEYQKQMKELRSNPKEMMAVQKKAMQLNMTYMKHSLKPTIITFIPIILIFGWLNSHLAFMPIEAGDVFSTTVAFDKGITGEISMINLNSEEFSLINNETQDIIDNKATWNLTAEKEGEYLLEYNYEDNVYTKEILITSEPEYKTPIRKVKNSDIKTITINHKPLKTINIFGIKLGWIWSYIIFSIIFSMVLRKLFKVY